jgi:tRNA(Arg) A34 adenosine deaminase TadA
MDDVDRGFMQYTTLRYVIATSMLGSCLPVTAFLNSPCVMCTGAILLYKIPRVVIGENTNWVGGEELLKSNGVEVVVLDDPECKALMQQYIKEKPEVSQTQQRLLSHRLRVTHTLRKQCRTGTRISGNDSSVVVYGRSLERNDEYMRTTDEDVGVPSLRCDRRSDCLPEAVIYDFSETDL